MIKFLLKRSLLRSVDSPLELIHEEITVRNLTNFSKALFFMIPD